MKPKSQNSSQTIFFKKKKLNYEQITWAEIPGASKKPTASKGRNTPRKIKRQILGLKRQPILPPTRSQGSILK